jgi:hypothetical protein
MMPLTWNADRKLLGDSRARTRFSGKWRNFLGANGWEPIDLTVREAGSFGVSRAPYALTVPRLANDWCTIESTNRYDLWTKQIRPDLPVGIQKRYPTAVPVAGIVTAAGILFPGAFPAWGADRLVQPHEQEVRDLVVFSSEPPGNGDLQIPFEIDFGSLPILVSRGRGRTAVEIDFRSDRDANLGLSFTTGRFRGVRIKPLRAWDSVGRSYSIGLRGRVAGTRFVGMKVIPRSIWRGAVYPVLADTTSTFYPDPDAESTSVDGEVFRYSLSGEAWSAIRGGDGTNADDSFWGHLAPRISSIDVGSGLWTLLGRLILLFDTSSLPDADPITAATLRFKVANWLDNFDQKLSLVAATPASNTALVAADYAQLGSTRFATDLDLGSLTTAAYNSLPLNTTGLTAISNVGITKLGCRLSGDLDNVEPTWAANTEDWLQFKTADETGTADDPYLEVIHGAAVSAPPCRAADRYQPLLSM